MSVNGVSGVGKNRKNNRRMGNAIGRMVRNGHRKDGQRVICLIATISLNLVQIN